MPASGQRERREDEKYWRSEMLNGLLVGGVTLIYKRECVWHALKLLRVECDTSMI